MTVLVVAFVKLIPTVAFQSDIVSVLPGEAQLARISKQHSVSQSKKIYVLYKPQASELQQQLANIDDLSAVESPSITELRRFYARHYPMLLAAHHQQAVQQPARFLNQVIARYYSPVQTLNDTEHDPFGTSQAYLAALPNAFTQLVPGKYGLQTIDNDYVFKSYEVRGQTLSVTRHVLAIIQQSQSKHGADSVIYSGPPFHILSATDVAQNEASTIGLFSLIAVTVLVWFVFHSIGPILVTVSAILAGCLTGAMACFILFEEMHLLSLVFGASLIGVAVDYAFHYLLASDRRDARKKLLLAYISSAVCYCCLLLQPLVVLHQVAVFSVVGLAMALLSVIMLSVCLKQTIIKPSWNIGSLPRKMGVVIALLAVLLIAYCSVTKNLGNQINLFYSPTAELTKQERAFIKETGQHVSGKTLFVSGATQEAVLQRQEQLLRQHSGFICYASYLPSKMRIKQGRKTMAPMYSEDHLRQLSKSIGLDAGWVSRQQKRWAMGANNSSLPQQAFPVSLSALQPVADAGHWYAPCLVLNESVSKVAELANRSDTLTYYDFVTSATNSLDELSQKLLIGLLIGCLLVVVLLMLIKGRLAALRVVSLPFASGVLALALAAVLFGSINFFHIVALFLVLGIGVDYAVFARLNAPDQRTKLAILCAGMTSILAFGLLALSSNLAVASFGSVVGFGILVAMIFSLIREGNA